MAYYYPPYGYYTPYNNGQQVNQSNNQPTQNNAYNGIIWVTGEVGARGYPVAPGQTLQLWDSEAQVIYLKSADASGMPTMKILDYEVRDTGENVLQKKKVEYVTREEFEKTIKELKGNE